MKNVVKNIVFGSILLSFGACASIGQDMIQSKVFSTSTSLNEGTNIQVLENTASENGYKIVSTSDKNIVFQKDLENFVQEGIGITHTISITVSPSSNTTKFDLVEKSNDGDIKYTQAKKNLVDFVMSYEKNLKTE